MYRLETSNRLHGLCVLFLGASSQPHSIIKISPMQGHQSTCFRRPLFERAVAVGGEQAGVVSRGLTVFLGSCGGGGVEVDFLFANAALHGVRSLSLSAS
jgi:hypothetical protein